MSKSPLSRGRRRRVTASGGRPSPPAPPNGTAQVRMGGQTLRYADGPATPIDPNLPAHLLSRHLTRAVNGHTDSYNAMARELVDLRERLERLEAVGASAPADAQDDSDGEAPTLGAVPEPSAETEAEPAASE